MSGEDEEKKVLPQRTQRFAEEERHFARLKDAEFVRE